MNGGPVRVFLHILLNCMYDVKTSATNFNAALSMLRFMILRDRTDDFYNTIHKIYGDWIEYGSTQKVLNMF